MPDPVKEHIVLLPDRLDGSVDSLLKRHGVSVEGKLTLTLKFHRISEIFRLLKNQLSFVPLFLLLRRRRRFILGTEAASFYTTE